jgi:enoyl-CoA hydratase/carnithine racemase
MMPDACEGISVTTVEAIAAAIAELPPDQVAQIREWLNEREEAEWDAQIERDERAGRLDALADRALAEYRAGRTRPL